MAASSVPGALPGRQGRAGEAGVLGGRGRAWVTGKPELGKVHVSQQRQTTDHAVWAPRGGGGGEGCEKAPGSGKDGQQRPERRPDAGCGNKGPSLFPRSPLFSLSPQSSHPHGWGSRMGS